MPEFTVEFGKDGSPPEDGRLDAAAFHRNHAAITPVLAAFLRDRTGDSLEIGSGTGQHAVAFAARLPGISWWPTDLNGNHLRSIAAWRAHAKLPDRKSTRLNSSHTVISYAVFCLKKKKNDQAHVLHHRSHQYG